MEKVVDLNKRIKDKKLKEHSRKRRYKVETIQKIVRCASCHFKCAMCGLHLEETDISDDTFVPSLGVTLCVSCKDEYLDFMTNIEGEEGSESFWHNKEWLDMWSAWLSYRKSIRAFIKSPEFRLMLEELKNQS